MLLQAALNGSRSKSEHLALPVSGEELIRDAVSCVQAGAGAIHLHPRDVEGKESLEAELVDSVVFSVRKACNVAVGVTTGAWIEPNLSRRVKLIQAWRAPDYASVNLSEEGSLEIMETLLHTGTGIEAGVWTAQDAELLGQSGFGNRVTRILVEPGELQVGDSTTAVLKLLEDIHHTLDRFDLKTPRLQHGDGKVTWVVLGDAIRRGIDTRVGLEDTLYLPDGEPASGNEALIRAARELGAGRVV